MRQLLELSSRAFGWTNYQVPTEYLPGPITEEQVFHMAASGLFNHIRVIDVSTGDYNIQVDLYGEKVAMFVAKHLAAKHTEIAKVAVESLVKAGPAALLNALTEVTKSQKAVPRG